MKNKCINKKTPRLFFLLLTVGMLTVCIIKTEVSASENNIIAIVDEISITEKDVFANKENVKQIFIKKYGKEPSSEELSIEISKYEKQKLSGKINSIFRENFIQKHGITVSKEEARAEFKNIYPGFKENPKAILEAERSYFQKLYLALKDASKNPENEEKVYETRLKDIMSFETWKGTQKYFNTPEKLEYLKQGIPTTVEDLYRSAEISFKAQVLEKKFEDVITQNVKVTDEEVKEFSERRYAGRKTKPQFEEVKSKLQQELLEVKKGQRVRDWWQEQYKKAKIEIKDKRFKDVFDRLIPSVKKKKPMK